LRRPAKATHPPPEARDAVIGLQDVLRRLERVEQRERLIKWAVLEGIWRDRRQHPRSLNRALYDAMPKPINPWIENPEERMPILRRAKEALRPILSKYRDAARLRGLGPVGRRVERDRELYDGAAGHVWEEVPIISGNKFLNPRLAPTVTKIFGGMISPSGQAVYSVVAPGTRIDPHCGLTNEMVTCHLGLMVPDVPTNELGISADGDEDHVVDVDLVVDEEDDVDDEEDHVNDEDVVVDKEDHGDNEDLVRDEDLVEGESTRRTGLGRQVFLLYVTKKLA
jgi:hypothetical protein